MWPSALPAYPDLTGHPMLQYMMPLQQIPVYYPTPMKQLPISPTGLVDSVDLVPLPMTGQLLCMPARPTVYTETQATAQADVVAGSIMAVTKNVKKQPREDIINATLFAQLAANAQYNRVKFPAEWYKYYIYVLGNIGFIFQGFAPISKYHPTSCRFKMDKVVARKLSKSASSLGATVAKSAISALGKLPKQDHSVLLFENQSENSKKGNFQVCIGDQASNGDIVVTIGQLYFMAKKNEPRYLWTNWKSKNISLLCGFQTAVLNEYIYAQVRQQIIDKLGKYIDTMISEIPL